MQKNVFILKVVDVEDNEHSIILGESYSKIHMEAKKEYDAGVGNLDKGTLKGDILSFVKQHSINGLNHLTLDFIVADERVISLSEYPFDEVRAKCFYIMVNGNTISKFKPVEYNYNELKAVWDSYKE